MLKSNKLKQIKLLLHITFNIPIKVRSLNELVSLTSNAWLFTYDTSTLYHDFKKIKSKKKYAKFVGLCDGVIKIYLSAGWFL